MRAVALKPTDGLVRGSLVTDTGGPYRGASWRCNQRDTYSTYPAIF